MLKSFALLTIIVFFEVNMKPDMFSTLLKNQDNVEIVRLTWLQVCKDLEVDPNQLTEEELKALPYKKITQFIINHLKLLESKSRSAIYQTLYKIDIPEEKLSLARRENPGLDLIHILAHLIIEREFMKVYLRKQYKTI
jgi:hypothetical protein